MSGRAVRIWLRAMELGARSGCHQLPERSFFIRGWQFPVCARCTGVLTGHLLSMTAVRKRLPAMLPVCCCLVTLTDWVAQQKGIMSNNRRRLVTGMIGGFGTGCIYFAVIRLIFGAVKDHDLRRTK